MAEEQKSRLTGIVGLLTAISGLIAALVALSGVLKPLFDRGSGNASVAISNGAAAPDTTVDAATLAGRNRPSSNGVAQADAPANRQTGGGGGGATANGGTEPSAAETPAETAAEPIRHHEEPAEATATDDSPAHESE